MYGILSLIRKKFGKDAMRRVLDIIKKYPDDRMVDVIKNRRAPGYWYETYNPWTGYGGRGGYDETSRLRVAENLLKDSSRWLDPHPGTFMNYVRHRIKKPKTFKGIANYFRLNPEARKILDDYYRHTGGEGRFSREMLDDMLSDAIRGMSRKDLGGIRSLTDTEKYMLALEKQKTRARQSVQSRLSDIQRGEHPPASFNPARESEKTYFENIIPFPKSWRKKRDD